MSGLFFSFPESLCLPRLGRADGFSGYQISSAHQDLEQVKRADVFSNYQISSAHQDLEQVKRADVFSNYQISSAHQDLEQASGRIFFQIAHISPPAGQKRKKEQIKESQINPNKFRDAVYNKEKMLYNFSDYAMR